MLSRCLGGLFSELFSLLHNLLNWAHHVEGNLRQVVVFTLKDGVETLDGLSKRHELASLAGEDFGDLEGLRHETLDLSGTGDSNLVLFAQLVHTQDGNDILKGFVVLKIHF